MYHSFIGIRYQEFKIKINMIGQAWSNISFKCNFMNILNVCIASDDRELFIYFVKSIGTRVLFANVITSVEQLATKL